MRALSYIRDLPQPITAAKADWLVASHWIGFTPAGAGLNARSQCQSTISAQARGGYVIEYITQNFGNPNPGFETDPRYLAERAAHRDVAGRLVAVHRLRPSARSLRTILGDADFNRLQAMWAEDGKRYRWSVAFPIIESYSIPGEPHAADVFDAEAMKRLFAHPSATLRPLNDRERNAIAGLSLLERPTANTWIGIEDEFAMSERSEIDERTRRLIEQDLAQSVMEGLTSEQQVRVRRRAAWLAVKFAKQRRDAGLMSCDKCGFDPVARVAGSGVKPRSLMDVHHKTPLQEGVRYTSTLDFELLCPTCHRFIHANMRLNGPRTARAK